MIIGVFNSKRFPHSTGITTLPEKTPPFLVHSLKMQGMRGQTVDETDIHSNQSDL